MEQKILFSGPVGAGKSTAIASISDIPVVATEAAASDETVLRKLNTTVAMDYGALHLADGAKVHLYGTPGQERFSFMWEILAVGGLGLVLLLDNQREQPLKEMEFYLNAFQGFLKTRPVVIGVTRMELGMGQGLAAYRERLRELGVMAPVFEVDARRREDVKILLQALLAMLDPGLRRN